MPACGPPSCPSSGASAKIESLSFGIPEWSPHFYVPMVGVKKRFFEKHGVKLRVVFTGSEAAIQAVLDGSINMAAATSGSAFLAQMQAPELKQIVGVVERSPYTLVVRPGITSIADLRGRVLGGTRDRSGESTETMRLMLRDAGLAESDYKIVTLRNVTELGQALGDGTIAGLAALEPQVTMLREAGMEPLARASDYPTTRTLNVVVMVAMRPWYSQHEGRVTNFYRGWAEAADWLHDPKNRAEAIRIYAETLKLEERYAAATYRFMIEEINAYSPRGRVNRDGLRAYADVMRLLGHTIAGDIDAYADQAPWQRAFGRQSKWRRGRLLPRIDSPARA